MALTLLEFTKLDPSKVIRNSVIQEFTEYNNILREITFESIQGNAIEYSREETLPAVGFRALNGSFPEGTSTVSSHTESLKFFGGDLDVDKRFMVGNGQRRAQEETMKIKALSRTWTEYFLKGDSTANPLAFDGLQARIKDAQLLDAGSTSGGDPLSLHLLDKLIACVSMKTHLIMNQQMLLWLTAASRDTSVGGQITFTQDMFGQQLVRYAGLPILVVDHIDSGNEVLSFDEENPGGGTPESTSIYCVNFNPGGVQGIQGYNPDGSEGISVRDLGELQGKPAWRTRVEWDTSFVIYHSRAAARLRGIKNAPVVA